MASVARALLVVLLTCGCQSQSTTGDYDDESLTQLLPQLEMLVTKLEEKLMMELRGLQQQLASRSGQLPTTDDARGLGKYVVRKVAPTAQKRESHVGTRVSVY